MLFANTLQLGAHYRVCQGILSDSDSEGWQDSDSDDEFAADDEVAAVVTQPAPLHTLARRPPRPWGHVVPSVPPQVAPLVGHPRARDYREVQILHFVYVLYLYLLMCSCRSFGGTTSRKHTKHVRQISGSCLTPYRGRLVTPKTRCYQWSKTC